MTRGQYTDPKSMQITFRQYAEKWLDSKTPSAMTRKELGRRLRLHVYPVLGSRPIGTFRPEHIKGVRCRPGSEPRHRPVLCPEHLRGRSVGSVCRCRRHAVVAQSVQCPDRAASQA